MTGEGRAVLLYDGTCGLCASSVQFILRHERHRALRFAPLQGAFAAQIRARHPALAQVDSMIWVELDEGRTGEVTYVRSSAALRAATYLGGGWRLAAIGRLVPTPLRDMVYDLIARHRHRLSGAEQCYLPPPDMRSRFVE